MSFVALQETLRKEVRKRIEAGELTGMELARRTGFTQAHISNFMNRKRGLKLSALDRMLKAIGLSLYDLLNPHELARFAAAPTGSDADYAEVPMVADEVAASSAVIVNEEVQELLKLRRSLLSRIRPDLAAPERKSWTRFVLIRTPSEEGESMWPRLSPGSILLIDRHYTTLRPYRKNDRNIYLVRKDNGSAVKHVELNGSFLILRPSNPDYAIEVLSLPEEDSPADRIVGRVAHVFAET